MKKVVYILTLVLFSGCYEKISLVDQGVFTELLVVIGGVDLNDDSIIKVGSSYSFGDGYSSNDFDNEIIWIEDNNGKRYESTPSDKGHIFSTKGGDKSLDYKVHVEFVDGRKYESLPIQIYDAPSIDIISFEEDRSEDKYQFYLNFENKINECRYYRIKYSIKWKETTVIYSEDRVDKYTRYYQVDTSDCFRTDYYNVNSAKHLLLSLSKDDRRIKEEMSITAYLMALTYDGFMYWNSSMVNMREIGTIYAPQPSEIKGNIICTSDPKVDALGFVSGGSVSTFERTFYWADF